MKKIQTNPSQSIGGYIILAVGAIFLLDSLNIMNFGHFIWNWWPVILIIMGLSKFLGNNHSHGLLLIIIGTVFLSSTLGFIHIGRLWRFWPLILIGIGLQIILKSPNKRKLLSNQTNHLNSEYFNLNGIFNGGDHWINSKNLKGGEAFVLFGGLDIDLTNAEVHADGCNFSFTSICGGIEVKVPKNWSVVTSGTSIFGGVSNKTVSIDAGEKVSVNLNGTVLFGGIEIKN